MMRMIALMLAALLAQEVAWTDRDGARVAGRAEGTVALKTAWGTLTLPLSALDSLRVGSVREEEVAGLDRAVVSLIERLGSPKREEADAAERDLVRLGIYARESVEGAAEIAQGETATRLWRILERLPPVPPPLGDTWSSPSFSGRGWIVSADVTVGGRKRPIGRTATVDQVGAAAPSGPILVRMTDGSILSGRFDQASLRVGATDVALAALRSLVIDERGAARVQADRSVEGRVDAKTLAFEGAFGKIALPISAIGAVMAADWSPKAALAPDGDGYLRDWLIYGTVPIENDDLEANHLDFEDEALLAPIEGEPLFDRKWIAYRSPRSDVSVLQALPNQAVDNFVCYGVLYVRAKVAFAGTLLVSSDDGVRVWLNGAHLWTNHVHRGVDNGVDRVPARLHAGWNRLIVKIDNGWGPAGWRMRFQDDQGANATGLELTLEAPPIFRGR